MDFGVAAAAASQKIGGLSIFDGEALETPPSLQTRIRLTAAPEAKGSIPATTAGKAGKGWVPDIQALAQAPAHACRKQPQRHELGYSSSGGGGGGGTQAQAQAQRCNRTAKNGREQQRAQKISDVIDQLKVTLDKANFSSGSSSKLHVLVSCESYLRSLREKIRCYEMEAKLRETARGHRQPSPPPLHKAPPTVGAAGPRIDDKIKEWASGKSNKSVSSGGGSSRSGETDRMDTGDDCSSSTSSGSSSGSSSAGTTSRRRRLRSNKSTENVNKHPQQQQQPPPPPLYAVSSSSSDDDENSVGGGRSSGADGGGVLGIAGVAPRGSSTDNSSSTGSDGDTGSSDSGGGSTSAGTTDSGSQGFTTDTTSRGFTTDSSFSGYTGSLGSGSADTGSADGGSEESEEGTSSSRMRVVNYFDIFRLSNVPMAIADKGGALVDVNDAMRGFGRIHQDTVSTLTVRSLVAPESSQALQDAMSSMLAASSLPQDHLAPPQQQQMGAKPFLANAGIGNRPTLLTVSLVYDESGEASAFHVALIPRTTGDDTVDGGHNQRSSTEYDAEAPGVMVQKAAGQEGGAVLGRVIAEEEEEEGREEPGVARKRSPGRAWDAGGQTKSQKR